MKPLSMMALIALSIVAVAASARAGDDEGGTDYYAGLSCEQLWYERNAIYARHGYCFKDPRAIARFGTDCRPPYGVLPSHLGGIVENIRALEKRRGCR